MDVFTLFNFTMLMMKILFFLSVVRHEFHNDTIYLKKRSYLRPCAHPWAALVLFDSILVSTYVIFTFYCSIFHMYKLNFHVHKFYNRLRSRRA